LKKRHAHRQKTRPNPTKKCRLFEINAHFEEDFNTVLPSAIVFQPPAKKSVSHRFSSIKMGSRVWMVLAGA
jgi:hypothetical protein